MLIFCIGLGIFTDLLTVVDDDGYQCIASFYEEPKGSLDAVYVGSSNCYSYWNPLFSWEEYGVATAMYASPANSFYSTEYLIKEVRKTQPEALIIVNINSLSDELVGEVQIHNLIKCIPFSLNKLALIHNLSEIGGHSLSKRAEFYLPIIRYHSRLTSLKKEDLQVELKGLKGASDYDLYLKRITDVTEQYVTTDRQEGLPEKLVSSTESLLDYCDKEQVNVLFVTVPQARKDEETIGCYNALNELLKKRGYPVLDLITRTADMGIDLTTDFYNAEHTNIHGSIKFTKFLSEYLIDQYKFEDKRDNAAYASWHTAYDKYADVVAPYVLDFEMNAQSRVDIEAPTLAIQQTETDAQLQWTAVDGAEGYAIYGKTGADGAWERVAESTQTAHTVSLPSEGERYYTVVPFVDVDGNRRYGDFSYTGVALGDAEQGGDAA